MTDLYWCEQAVVGCELASRVSLAVEAGRISSVSVDTVPLAGATSVDHCTYLTDDDIDALAGSEMVATLLPATDFSTRQPYPNARAFLMPESS